jgi:RNA polymerase sigma-70 factor (ECF subfamily)
MSVTRPSDVSHTRHAGFHTTHWSLVLAAQGGSEGEVSQSLETLCQRYWPPLYAYVRHRGHSPHDAQDLTQAFFARLLEKDWLTAAHPEGGRFRSFLLMALKRFLANEWDRTTAQKRGGGLVFLSLDAAHAESVFATAPPSALPAEALFEKRWALTLLERVMTRLRQEHNTSGRQGDYELLKPCLTTARGDIRYDELAVALNITPASARSVVHRLRKRFREIFREEVAATLADPADVDDEMRAVIAALDGA